MRKDKYIIIFNLLLFLLFKFYENLFLINKNDTMISKKFKYTNSLDTKNVQNSTVYNQIAYESLSNQKPTNYSIQAECFQMKQSQSNIRIIFHIYIFSIINNDLSS